MEDMLKKKDLIARLSQRFWTTTSKGTVNQLTKNLNSQLRILLLSWYKMVKILWFRRSKTLA